MTTRIFVLFQISASKETDNAYPKTAQVTLNSATVPQDLRDSLYQVAEVSIKIA